MQWNNILITASRMMLEHRRAIWHSDEMALWFPCLLHPIKCIWLTRWSVVTNSQRNESRDVNYDKLLLVLDVGVSEQLTPGLWFLNRYSNTMYLYTFIYMFIYIRINVRTNVRFALWKFTQYSITIHTFYTSRCFAQINVLYG